MQKSDVINHFGGVIKTAKALGMSKQAVSAWNDNIPQGRAYQIQLLTKGKLKAVPKLTKKAG